MSESQAYRWLKKNVLLPKDRVDRIENAILTGMPDVNLCIDGVESWIEIKSPTEPKRSTTPLFGSNHKLSQEQKNWILRQKKAGGRVFIFIETDKRRILIDGAFSDGLNEKTIDSIIVAATWSAAIPTNSEACNLLREALKKR